METDAKIIAMPGVALQSPQSLSVDEWLAKCAGRYTKIVIIGLGTDGMVEINSPNKNEEALWMIMRAQKIVLE